MEAARGRSSGVRKSPYPFARTRTAIVVSHGIWEGSFADCRYCADCGIFLLERPAQPPKFGERLRGKFGRLRGGGTTE